MTTITTIHYLMMMTLMLIMMMTSVVEEVVVSIDGLQGLVLLTVEVLDSDRLPQHLIETILHRSYCSCCSCDRMMMIHFFVCWRVEDAQLHFVDQIR